MNTISLELRKYRRSGVIPVLIAPGVLGLLYSIIVFALRRETMLSLPLSPMTIFLSQLYGVIMMLNLFGIVVAAAIIFNIEFQENAIRKMTALPIRMAGIYGAKCLIISCSLFINILLQSIALWYNGITYLPAGTFDMTQLVINTAYYFIVAMPVIAFMMLVSSRLENIWVSLGIGVAGFISGICMSLGGIRLFLINPFVLIMQPAISFTAILNKTVIAVSVIETVLLIIIGLLIAKHSKYE